MKSTDKVIVVIIQGKIELHPEDYGTDLQGILDTLREVGDAEVTDIYIKEEKQKK